MNLLSTRSFAVWTGGRWNKRPPEGITAFNIDSRIVRSGQMFVALATSERDGHDFVSSAQSNGAAAALVSREIDRVDIPQLVVENPLQALQKIAGNHRKGFGGLVIGVTGSCGKTSTKDLLTQLLPTTTLKTQGNLNNHLGVPLTLSRLRPGHTHAVVEVGMNKPGEIAKLANLTGPDYSVITTVAPAHLQGIGSIEEVAFEKAAMAAATQKLTVLPTTCFQFAAFQALESPLLAVGTPESGISYPENVRFRHFEIEHHAGMTRVYLHREKGPDLKFQQNRMSEGMARNTVLALLLGLELGIDAHLLQTRLKLWKPGLLRGERAWIGNLSFFIDCYNSNPLSMRDSLDHFHAITPEETPRYYVLGGMGELGPYTEEYHWQLGQSFQMRPEDHLFITGREIFGFLAGYKTAGGDESQVTIFEDKQAVVQFLREGKGAVFLKGSRAYMLETIYEELKKEHYSLRAVC